MIVNRVNLSHCQRNADECFLLVEVLKAIQVQQEHMHYEAATFAKRMELGKWVTENEASELCLAYDKAQSARVESQSKALAMFNRDQSKMVLVDGMALFKIEEPINTSMTLPELKGFIEQHRSGLGVKDLEQASGVLYKLALTGCQQVRVKNNV